MGRLTEAMRRAADAAGQEPSDVVTDAAAALPSEMNDATDDLFPIEIAGARPLTPSATAGLSGEPAGTAVIAPGVPPPVVMAAQVAAEARPRAVEPTPYVDQVGYGMPQTAAPVITIDEPPRPERRELNAEIFERLDATLAQKIVVDQNIMPVSREQYRRLAATLHHAQADTGLKVVMIASAVVGEGKTLTASNLALTFSESYQRTVLLIDGDFRRPALHVVFNIDAPSGLSEGLAAVVEQKLPLYRVSQRLTILPAGRPTSDPMASLTSNRMRRVIQEARDAFDWVIVDTPPVGLLPDANLLAAMVDGAVLVVRANSTPYHQVVRAIDALDRDRLLGVVLNSATSPNGTGHNNYYTYYHGTRPQADQ
ncbi:MAG TPA: CpsD/CapB family tyrosine-protein kinase [Vicinamibacterales bacterium]|nr:CpsD/CapB family tyrosine-protein kinase [Vicinamibacterales bacterium]